MVEVAATREGLVDPSRRDTSTYFASWQDGGRFASESPYQLPAEAWERLRGNEELAYRVWTSASTGGWRSVAASTPDDDIGRAPVMRITD